MIASTQTNQPFDGDKHTPEAVIERAVNRLKAAGMRITQPRLKLLAVLARTGVPTSVDALYEAVGPENCDLVTVYRCMAAFEQVGVVRRAFRHDGAVLFEFEMGRSPQYRINCKATGEIQILDPDTAGKLRASVEAVEEILRARGFRDVTHLLEFFAVSPSRPGHRLGLRGEHLSEATASQPRR